METSSEKAQPTRKLGRNGPEVFPLALGCMGMSAMYGPADEAESRATINAALDAGVTLFDTGDFYGVGHNEMLLGSVLKGRQRDQVQVSVKFGALRSPDGGWTGVDCRPEAVKNFLAYSLTRLGLDYIDVYRPARLDPNVPIAETMGAIKDLIQAGYVKHAGLSEVGVDTIRLAHAVLPIADLQIEYSLLSRTPEEDIFPLLEELGIAVTAYGVLSRGLLSGSVPSSPADFRAFLPRFSGKNLERNKVLVAKLSELAAEKGITPSQLAIAWVMGRSPSIIPVIGSRTRAQFAEAIQALAVALTPEDLLRIKAAIPIEAVAGTRYGAHQMRMLDSERRPSQ